MQAVRPRAAAAVGVVHGELPPMAGQLVRDGGDLCFVPRFAFVDGTTYAVDRRRRRRGGPRPAPARPPGHDRGARHLPDRGRGAAQPAPALRAVLGADERGLCRPRTSGSSTTPATPLAGALLPTEHELWDADRRRLTVLLDPARIKRGLVRSPPGRLPAADGQAVPAGRRRRVPRRRRGCRSEPAPSGATRSARTSAATSTPAAWTLTVPPAGTAEPLEVTFDRPLDHGLLAPLPARDRSRRPPGRRRAGDRARRSGPGGCRRGEPWAPGPTSSSSIPSWKTWPATRSAGCSTGTWPEPRTRHSRSSPSPCRFARADPGRTSPPAPGAPTRAHRR